MDDKDIFIEDWKETKTKIQHFDDVVMRTRLEGIPIATSIIAAALIAKGTLTLTPIQVGTTAINVTALIVLGGLLYLTSVLLLDILHYRLLIHAVNHAKKIEARPEFKDKLHLTHSLHSRGLTALHNAGGIMTYVSIYAFGIFLLFAGI